MFQMSAFESIAKTMCHTYVWSQFKHLIMNNIYINRGGEFLETYFRLLNECGVRYCVLRNYLSLPHSAGGSDVDMWVHTDDVDKALRLSNDAKNACGYHLVSRYGDVTAEKLCFQCEADGVQFDIFRGAIYYKNSVFVDGDTILRHTHKYNGISVLDDDFGDLIAFLKEILNNGRCSEKYSGPIMGNDSFTEGYLHENLPTFTNSFVALLHQFINDKPNGNDAACELAIAARAALSSSNGVSRAGIVWHKIKRLFRHPGYVIAFDGRSEQSKMERIAALLEGGFHHGVTICSGNVKTKQVLQTFAKAKVFIVERARYRCWLHPMPDIVVDASLSEQETMQWIVKAMAERFE